MTFGQKALFDTLSVNSKTKIIGRHPHYDKNETYSKYNFIIEDSASVVAFKNMIKLGSETRNELEDPGFKLTVVKNFDELGSWTINPMLGSAMTHDGHTYKFDLSQISKLSSSNPLNYYLEKKKFESKADYETYLTLQKKNPKFLFDYAPQFKYAGSFEIQFIKSDKFPHPKAISEFLAPEIEKLVSKDEYSLGYVLNKKNKSDPTQFTMTIQGPSKLFKKLKLKGLNNENWKNKTEEGYFFYIK